MGQATAQTGCYTLVTNKNVGLLFMLISLNNISQSKIAHIPNCIKQFQGGIQTDQDVVPVNRSVNQSHNISFFLTSSPMLRPTSWHVKVKMQHPPY